MAMTLEELTLAYERQAAVVTCRNMMARYVMYHACSRHKEYVAMWADRDDCILDMPWGIYLGKKGVERCYLVDHGDRSDPEYLKTLKGCMFVHALDTECIEVAADGMTARASWISPGHETSLDENGKAHGMWAWSKYGVDFIKEDGEWKFWHMRVYPMFRTPYDKCWTENKPYDGPRWEFHVDKEHDEPPYEYDINGCNKFYPVNQPEPPTPYKTFDDVGYNL